VLTSVAKAITAYARAVELDQADFNTWIELSRLHRATGSLPQARQTAEAALQHVGGEWDRMVAENTLGEIAEIEGKLSAAAAHYQAGLRAAQAVLAADPDNNNRQREVSVSHERLGDVAVAQGDYAEALRCYQTSLPIAAMLAETRADHPGFANDLAITKRRIEALRARLRGE
jgi:tetratricopeptide (TPR) repeat protein